MKKVERFFPEINKIYFIDTYTLIHIINGKGSIQVDFKNYYDWKEKAIFLEKGQYIKFLSEDFEVRRIEFFSKEKFYDKDVRVLFKHLISLGYIDLLQCEECNKFLSNTTISQDSADIIDISSRQWYWQNPFNANKEEYQVIFDVKECIDNEYVNNLKASDLVELINHRGYNAQALIKNKVGLSVKKLLDNKKLNEGYREIAFTDKSIQEISYNLGYKDDAYFNRFFKNRTGQTPKQFRENFDFDNRDQFMQDIQELLTCYHTKEHSIGFYADKMHMSIKTLSSKVRAKMNNSLGQLIRLELINTAKLMILEGESVAFVAMKLGFDEPSHFTRFFKNYVGCSPTDFKIKKYNS